MKSDALQGKGEWQETSQGAASAAPTRNLLARRRDALVALTLFGLAFGIYVGTLPTSITWQNFGADSGELAAAVYTLGVAHPPGYPTYLILGKLFSFLPFGELAFRTNLMSAFFGAATVSLLYFITLDLITLIASDGVRKRGTAAAVSAGMAALSLAAAPIVWSQAIITEVYALNTFFAAAIVFLLARRAVSTAPAPTRLLGDRYLLAAAFLLGLGLGNHFTLVFLAPPALLLIAARWSKKSFLAVPGIAVGFLIGLSVYVYLPVSAAQDPPVNWGQANELSGFWWTVSGTPYRQFTLGASSNLWLDRLKDWWGLLIDQYYYPGVALGLIGAWRLWRRHILAGIFSLTYILLLVTYAGTYQTPDSVVYLIPGFMVFAAWIGLGLYWTLSELMPQALRRLRPGAPPRWYAALPVAIVLIVFALVPAQTLAFNYSDQDMSNDTEATDYGQQVLSRVEDGSLLLVDTDTHIFALWYAQFVTSPRPEVFLVTHNLLAYDWYTESMDQRYPGLLPAEPGSTFQDRLSNLIRINLNKRPIYLTDRTTSNLFLFSLFEIEPVAVGEGDDVQLLEVTGLSEESSF